MKNRLRVFSIEEFSVYDGPGIRTTIFLKGCPLRCSWCHSPEGQEMKNIALRSPNGCLECGECIRICPTGRKNCTGCGKCLEVCPRDLIRMAAVDYLPEELAASLEKNFDILKMNGGGLTFSGGEPLMQSGALFEILDLLKGKIHLALQTCGYASEEVFEKALERVDLVLFDMKIMDLEKAREYEGVDNGVIFKNLEILKKSGVPFLIRVPLIPTLIDTEENLKEIIRRVRGAENLLSVELLPYNKYAGSKYKMVGREYDPRFDETIPSNPHLELFEKENVRARVL